MSMGSTSLSSLDQADHITLNRWNKPGPNYQWILMLPLKSASGALQRGVCWTKEFSNNFCTR